MTSIADVIELRLDGCTVAFNIRERKNGYVYFDIASTFQALGASLPLVERCALSHYDVRYLARYAEWSLDETRPTDMPMFAGYDAFFMLEFLAGDSVRVMISYAPEHSISLGVEGSVSEEDVLLFRDGWLRQLAE